MKEADEVPLPLSKPVLGCSGSRVEYGIDIELNYEEHGLDLQKDGWDEHRAEGAPFSAITSTMPIRLSCKIFYQASIEERWVLLKSGRWRVRGEEERDAST